MKNKTASSYLAPFAPAPARAGNGPGPLRGKYFSVIAALVFTLQLLNLSTLEPLFASTGCNYPTTLDSWIDKTSPATISIAEVNQFRCAIEKLETGPLRPAKGSATAPAFSFLTDSDVGMDSSGLNILDWSIAGVYQWRMDATAFFPVADNLEDIGKAANRIKDLYMAGVFRAGLDATLGTITADDPIFNATATWNNSVVTFNGIKLNVTNTASHNLSRLMDLQVDAVSKFSVDRDGNIVSGSLTAIPSPNARRWSYILSTGSALSTVGDTCTETGTPTHSAANDPADVSYASGAVAGNDAGIECGLIYRRANLANFQFKGGSSVDVAIRKWIGLASVTLATMTGSDNPAAEFAAFRFSTDAADTNWQACTKDGTTIQCLDTGVTHASTGASTEYEIRLGGSVLNNAVFKINGAIVATSTSNLPILGTRLKAFAGVETRAAAVKTITMAWMYVDALQ